MLSKALGFSLIELMVALALGLFLTLIMISSTVSLFRVGRNIEQTGEVAESSRYLVALLQTELPLAGYFGPIDYQPDITAVPPDICSGPLDAGLNNALAFAIQGLNNVAEGSRLCGGDTLLAGSDVLLIRRASSMALNPFSDSLLGVQHYIQAVPNNVVLDIGADPAVFSLRGSDGLTPAPIRAWHQAIYYIAEDSTFKRRRFHRGSLGPAEPLAEGVDDFQLSYGIDRSGNGIPNAKGKRAAFVDAPASAQEWHNIVAVEFYLLLSSTDPSPNPTKNLRYSYAEKTNVAYSDQKIRRLFKGFAPLKNAAATRNSP